MDPGPLVGLGDWYDHLTTCQVSHPGWTTWCSSPSPVAWSPRTSSTSCSGRWSTVSSPPVTPCPASVGWPRCSASPVRPCVRPCSASPRPAWWRSATVAARPSATTAPRPASTCSRVSWCATAELDPAVGRSILQARQAIAPAVAALAAEHGGNAATETLGDAVDRPRAGGRLRGPAARRAGLLGRRRRRGGLHRLPTAVQQPSDGLRAGHHGPRPGDGRRGRQPGGLPRASRTRSPWVPRTRPGTPPTGCYVRPPTPWAGFSHCSTSPPPPHQSDERTTMTKPSPEIEAKARERLAADERRMASAPAERITGARRTTQTLGEAWGAFWRHPSPWLIGGFLVAAVAYRATVGDVLVDRADRAGGARGLLPRHRVGHPRGHPALATAPRGRRPGRLVALAQAPCPPRRPAGPAPGVHPVAGGAVAAPVVRRDRAAGLPRTGGRRDLPGRGRRPDVRLRVGALPRAQ